MIQPDLFDGDKPSRAVRRDQPRQPPTPPHVPAILARLGATCERPRYCFMVLNLIAQVSGASGMAGPYIEHEDERVPVRDWLWKALSPIGRREHQRPAMIQRAERDLAAAGRLPIDPVQREASVKEEVQRRLQHSGRTNVSRAVSELVRAGLVQRHYQGFRVDHLNRGAQRHVVYSVGQDVRLALANARQM